MVPTTEVTTANVKNAHAIWVRFPYILDAFSCNEQTQCNNRIYNRYHCVNKNPIESGLDFEASMQILNRLLKRKFQNTKPLRTDNFIVIFLR